MYVEKAKEEQKQRNDSEEMEWHRTRLIWTVLMNANFKKQGGGKYSPQDLIRLSFDDKKSEGPIEKPTLETFERLVAKHGKRKKRRG